MAENRPHLEIPAERVRVAVIKVRGRAKPFTRPNYSAHGDFLRERTASVAHYAASTLDAAATESVFLEIRTPSELPARGERQRLRQAGLEVVALSAVDPQRATVQVRKSEIAALQRLVAQYADSPRNTGKSYLAVIEDIGPVPPEAKVATELSAQDDEVRDCLLVFYASLSERERAGVLLAMRSFMARGGHSIAAERRLSNGVTLVEARLRPSEAREAGAAFSTLRQIVPNSVFFVPDGRRISQIAPGITVEPPELSTSIAVVDTGISASCEPVERSTVRRLPHLPPGAVRAHGEHGTFVASRLLFGDSLEQDLRAGVLRPLCRLVDVPVIGVDAGGQVVPLTEGHLAQALDTVLPELDRQTRVVNISLGNETPTIDGHMSIVGQVLDKHARDCNLLVVTTAGNIRDRGILQSYPGSLVLPGCRIDSPGDSLLSLTVGSFAKYGDDGALSRARELSAFSRRGPGPFGGMKPDLVAHGGNCLPDGTTSARIGVHGLGVDGRSWECDRGTSFAAPLVAAMGARLFEHYSNPHANLVRALLLHFATPVITPDVAIKPEHMVGAGEPQLERALWACEHSVAYLHAGAMAPSRFTYLPFYVPACLAEGSGGKLQIRVTVVMDPPVSPDNQLEYSKSRVSLALRKPSEVGHRTVSVADDALDADRWSPVTQLQKDFTRSYQTGEWELQLRLWCRDVPDGFSQSFGAIVEVIDSTGTQPVRTAAENEAGGGYRRLVPRVAA
ncbi:MAG: S8 family peptidase [Gemmatimonadaceae bacterium]